MIVEIVGKFYDNHSLTIINRNIAIGLAKKFDVYLTSLDQFDPEFKLNSDIVGELKKLEANRYLELDCISNTIIIKPIKNKEKTIYDQNIPFSKAKSITHDLVLESVLSRKVSDVPIGTFLSGGVDSSIVSLCISQITALPIDTFSIGFEKKSFDESDKAKLVSKLIGSKHHQFTLSEKDLLTIPTIKEKSAQNLVTSIKKSISDVTIEKIS